jgi:hypothetical protein
MKKVASIVAVAIFTLGLTATAIENASNEFESLKDTNTELACSGCSKSEDTRGGNTL